VDYYYLKAVLSFNNITIFNNYLGKGVTDLINQVSQLLRAELKELVDEARATMEPIEPCDEE